MARVARAPPPPPVFLSLKRDQHAYFIRERCFWGRADPLKGGVASHPSHPPSHPLVISSTPVVQPFGFEGFEGLCAEGPLCLAQDAAGGSFACLDSGPEGVVCGLEMFGVFDPFDGDF